MNKIINQMMKHIKKSKWYQILLFIVFLLLTITVINSVVGIKKVEGMTNNKKKGSYVVKNNKELYDKLYSAIYDQLVFDEKKNTYEIKEIKRITKMNDKSKVLDVGSGSGHHVAGFKNMGILTEGIDSSMDMVNKSKLNYPELKFKHGSAEQSMMYDKNSFSHITCLYFTIYYMENKQMFLRNCFQWLKPSGYLILHLVNRNKFDPIVNAGDPLTMVSAQKYAKKRITNSIVKFNNFRYKANFELEKDRNIAHFKEVLTYDKDGSVRENNHLLYMDTQKYILGLAKSAGFALIGKVDMVNCMYEYQYLYILQKPINV